VAVGPSDLAGVSHSGHSPTMGLLPQTVVADLTRPSTMTCPLATTTSHSEIHSSILNPKTR